MEFVRSPLLMNRDDTVLLVVDIQEKLIPHINNHERISWNTNRLIAGANALDIPVYVSEQYPKGLGNTDAAIVNSLGESLKQRRYEKTMFSCRECGSMLQEIGKNRIKNVLLTGIETHVCVLQTALDLLAAGFEVFVCSDAVGSRFDADYRTALSRMESSGVTLVTTEMALFEWCEKAGSNEFKTIGKIVQETFSE